MAINKVEFGDQTLMDLTGDTVTPEDVLNGATFHDRAGVSRSGTASYPVTDVQVNNTSVLDGTVAKVTVPTNTSDLTNDSNFVADASYVHTDNNYTTTEKNKLSGIASGAEVNVQSDWNQTDSTKDDYIKNKPSIPSAQVNSDWNASSGVAQILNKPTLGTAAAKNYTTSVTSGSSDLVTSGAVYTAIDNLPEPMVFKGSLGTGGTITALPVDGTATIGDTYKVITAGTYAGKAAKIGDTFICLTKTSSANTWELIPSGDEPSGTVTSVAISNGGGLSVSGSPITSSGTITISHADTSSQESVNNSGRTYIQDITLDTYGHVTGISSATETVTNNRRSFYGTCNTAAATAAKVVTISDTDGWELKAGTIVGVKFTNSNTASDVTLNINGTGAKSIWYNNAAYTGSSTSICGYANRLTYYMYDGTYWVWLNMGTLDGNTDTIPQAQCTTAASTAAKTAAMTYFTATAKSYVMVNIRYANTAASAITLNINSTGAKPIYINGSASSASNYTLPAGSYLVYYDGTNYYFRTDGKITGDITGDAATVNGKTVGVNVPSTAVFTDTKNTAGSTDSSSKLFLIGATSQAANPQTYSHDTAYVGTDGCLYSGGTKVLTAHQDISGKLNKSGDTMTGRLTTAKPINQIITGSGTTAQDKGSGVSPRYFPAKWTFNTGQTVTNGDIITIKIPCAGHDYGVFISIDNGTTYKPVSITGTTRLTTHYGNASYLTLIYKSDGQTNNVYAVAGADARSNVTGGCWLVCNYYDTGNTYDRNRYNAAIKAWGTTIIAGNIIVGINGLYHHLKEGTAFDISYPILYLNGDCNASATTTNTYDIINFTITTTQSITLTAYKPVYIKGTLSGTTFTPDSTTPLTQTVPTSADGKYYMFLGNATSTTAVYLTERHEIYAYKNGAFGQIVNDALSVNGYTVAKSVPSDAVFTDNNNAVTQTATTTSADYEVLFSATADNTTRTEGARKNSNLKFNPSTGNLQATQLNGVTIGSSPKFTDSDTKNTAGSTDTSSKIFLVGATSQAANPQTYSHDTAYVGTDGCLYSGGTKVLTAHQTIKQDGITGATVNRFGTCATAAATAAKTVDITTGTFALEAGSTVAVKFTNANTANSPTLNVNSKGAKNIFVNGAQITSGGNKALLTGTVIFVYDGTQWNLVGNYYDTNTQTVTGVKGNSESSYRTGNVNITCANIGAATSDHTHGNITNGGALQTTDITIASGDKLVVTDSSDSAKVARTSISFDGSTTTQCLTKKGTWATFVPNTGGTFNAANGTAGAEGATTITIGNATGAATANNSYGRVRLYRSSGASATTAYYTEIRPGANTANRTITFPDAAGTVALTSDIVNNAVTQTATSTNADYEVLFSVTADNTTRTEGARKNSNLKFNPSTGNLTVTKVNGEAVFYSGSVSAAVNATTCTISNTNITTSSMIEPFSSNSSGNVITVTKMVVTAGKVVLTFSALTEATSFKVRITNV